jgi:hypothetical protein
VLGELVGAVMSNEPELLSDVLARGVHMGLGVEAGLAEDIGRLCADLVADHAETVEPELEGSTAVEVAIVEAVGAGANVYLKARLSEGRTTPSPENCGRLWSDFFRSALAGVNGDDDCDGGGDDG